MLRITQIKILLFAIGIFFNNGPIYGLDKEILIPSGSYFPFFLSQTPDSKNEAIRKPIAVSSFWLDPYPVTIADFVVFLKKQERWRRSKIARIFADEFYLKSWLSDILPNSSLNQNRPVTEISWFAAAAYCESQGKELPTTDQWEYAAFDAGREKENISAQIISWYSQPSQEILSEVGQKPKNSYGIYDMHGLIWEWTLDFNGETLGFNTQDGQGSGLFCGSGSLGALDPSDYATFMRYSFRRSLQGYYTNKNLGFRCARRKSE